MNTNLSQIIRQYKEDKQSVYNTWFINNEGRLKAFRSIRRGVMQVIDDIKNKKFPNDFKGSSLEFVLNCITEQKQVESLFHLFPLFSPLMKKGLQKILLLTAVITVIAHSTLPHHHHEDSSVATLHQGDKQQLPGVNHHDDDKADHHGIFSFAQLDENFVPANSLNNSFELPLTYLPALIDTYLSDNFPVKTKTHFGWYKEYPPPEKNFSSFPHRGPPTA